MDESITVWTGQSPVVLKTLNETGRYIVRKSYVDQKYKETAWIFQEAYQYLSNAVQSFLPRPADAESPVWVYRDAKYIYTAPDTHILTLSVPRSRIFLFSQKRWNRIQNLSYLGSDSQDEDAFEKWLRERGITDDLAIFSTPYYPLEKRAVMKSWDRLFDNDPSCDTGKQGMTWELLDEWITADSFH